MMNNSNTTFKELATASVYTDFNSLARLRAQASQQSPEANKAVANQFEALLVQNMLKAMREASQLGASTDGEQTRFYMDMFDKQIALELARNGGIGLGAVIERQLSLSAAQRPGATAEISMHGAQASQTQPVLKWNPTSQQAFIEDLWPHALESAKELGVSADVLIAQAALETGWGRNMIHDQSGRNSFNLFGIKAGTNWQGPQITVPTLEYRDGIARKESATFRAYGSLQHSMNDYVEFLTNNPRYQQALEQADDAEAFLQALQQAGYATDPAYAEKISNIMSRESFTSVVSALQPGEAVAARVQG